MAEKSVSARPGRILEGTLGSRMAPRRAGMGPTSGLGWARSAGKQSTWRIWTGPVRTRDGTWTGPGPDPGEGLDGTPRDSNRRLGLSESCRRSSKGQQEWGQQAREVLRWSEISERGTSERTLVLENWSQNALRGLLAPSQTLSPDNPYPLN